MRSSFFGNLDQRQLPGHFALQNSKILRVRLNGEVLARPGTMIACQGQVDVEEGVAPARPAALMRCWGQGLVFLSHDAYDVHLFYLEGDGLTVNGGGLLAFDSTLNWDIQPTQDAYVTTLHGTGWAAVCTHGSPVLLDTGRAPTFADAPSVVCWSTDLQVGVSGTGRGGAAIQLAFQGQGFVLVQSGENLR